METRQADEQRRRAPEDGKLVRKQKDKEVGRGQGAEKHRARPADEAHDGTSELSANVIDNSKKNSSSSKVSVYNNRKKNHLKGSTSTSVSTQNVPDADYWGQSSKLKDDILPSSRMVPSSAGDIATNDRPNRSAYTARHNTYYKSPYASQNPNADSVQQKPSAVPPSKSFQPSAKNSSMDASATDSAPHCPLSISKSNEIPIHEFRDKLDTERLLNRSLVLNNIPEDLLPERREQLGQAYLSLLHGGGGSALRWISPTLCLIVFSSEALCQRGIDRSKRKSEISEFPPVLMSSLPELCSNENLQVVQELYDNIPSAKRDVRVANRMISASLGIRITRSATSNSKAAGEVQKKDSEVRESSSATEESNLVSKMTKLDPSESTNS